MAAYFEDEDLTGFANWMRVQAEEELEHGMKFYDYIIRRGASVTLTAIEGPQTEWDSPVAAFEHVLEHEKKVTSLINNLAFIANEDRDFASINRLVWFIDEQVEEEESARDMITAVEAVEGNKYGMYMLDKDLAARTYTQASPLAASAD